MNRYLYSFVLFGLFVYCESQGSRQATCTTPDSKQGFCINIKQCPLLLTMLTNQRNDPKVRDFLTKSTCGYEGRTPKVCCPNTAQNTINPPTCGVSNRDDIRIVGGQPAELGAHPWIAALGYRRGRQSGPPLWKCGGALITEYYVMTAAHCLYHPIYTLYLVRLGEHNLDENVRDGASPVDIEIEKVTPHPKYDAAKKFNDIALLKLKKQATYGKYIKPVCLPTTPELRSNDFSTLSPFVAGWGYLEHKGEQTTQLMEVQVPVVPNPKCKTKYAEKGGIITDNQICAGETGMDACQGDSGGPLVAPRNGTRFYVIGVVSYGYQCAQPEFPGIYTRVTKYVDWIADTVQK